MMAKQLVGSSLNPKQESMMRWCRRRLSAGSRGSGSSEYSESDSEVDGEAVSPGGDEYFGPSKAAAGTLAICYSIFREL